MIKKTKYFSWKTGRIARGCSLCVKGEKLVLFVTGLCPRHCFYCPISEQKWAKDVVYANEWKIKKDSEIIKEARLTNAKGAGITGGDPLARIDRVVRYIKMLKNEFGKNFHIHLYTPLELITEEKLKKMYDAGLDEIRIHPNIFDKRLWHKIDLVRKFNWSIGVEIPAIPNAKKETIELIEFFKNKIDFLNINELEISDTNAQELLKKGFLPRDNLSYGVKGSQELAFEIMKKYSRELNIHYCTTTLKDKVQLAKRIKKRARNVAKKYDYVTNEGMLIRGAIYLKELSPGFSYRKKIELANKKKILNKLRKIKNSIKKTFKIPKGLIEIDDKKLRILTSKKIIKKIANQIKEKELIAAIVKEYPTWDQLEVDVQML